MTADFLRGANQVNMIVTCKGESEENGLYQRLSVVLKNISNSLGVLKPVLNGSFTSLIQLPFYSLQYKHKHIGTHHLIQAKFLLLQHFQWSELYFV